MILYEFPFNERIRTYLRLEHLFARFGQLVPRNDPVDHHFALTTLFEIMDVTSRSELKSDVLKDLDRQKQLYNSYRGNPAISEQALDQVIAQLDAHFEAINEQVGKLSTPAQDSEFLGALRSRSSIPGGTCEFDLPGYYAWQHAPAERRREDILRWSASFVPLSQAIRSLMQMLRESGKFQKMMAVGGQVQQNLPQGRTFQLLRLRIDPALDVVPEISGNRLLVVMRMMRAQDGRLAPMAEDVPFEMSLCA